MKRTILNNIGLSLLMLSVGMTSCSTDNDDTNTQGTTGCGGLTILSANYIEDMENNFDIDGHFKVMTEGGTPPFTYSYEPLNETASEYLSMDDNLLYGVNPGKYKFTVKDANGCEATMVTVKQGFVILYTPADPLTFGGAQISWDIMNDGNVSNNNSGRMSIGEHEYFNHTHHRLSLFSPALLDTPFTPGVTGISGPGMTDLWNVQFDTSVNGDFGMTYHMSSDSENAGSSIIIDFTPSSTNGYSADRIKVQFNSVVMTGWSTVDGAYIEKMLDGTIGVMWYDGQ